MATNNVLTLEGFNNLKGKAQGKPIRPRRMKIMKRYPRKLKTVNFCKNAHNFASEDDEANDAESKETETETSLSKANVVAGSDQVTSSAGKGDKLHVPNSEFNTGSIHYVDACTLWKFPSWLVDRLQCSHVIENISTLPTQQVRRTLMEQLKATSTDLIMYATVRREFLRTIALIELNNVARLLEAVTNMEIDETLKAKFFESLHGCVSILEDESKPYAQYVIDLAIIIDDIYVSISPSIYLREQNAYAYNNVYCSYLVPGSTMQFTEMCCGGIVDNTWFSLESKYRAMVMVTPHVFDDPKGIQKGILREEKYRVEAYFDVSLGRYTAFDKHFKSTISLCFRSKISLEHLVFSFFSKSEHYVEEKNVFLMNGPETKGNLTFAKIYHCLVKSAVL